MLYRRSNSKYFWCRFTAPNGREIRQSTKTADRRSAQEYEDRLKAECWRIAALGEKPKRSWEAAVVRYLEETTHKSTHKTDIAYLRWADQFLGSQMLHKINRDMLDKLSAGKKATGVANATVNRMMEVVRTILNKAEREWEWIDRAPSVRMLREKSRRIIWLTRDQADKLLQELPDHIEAMARFSLATGLREANVTGLEWSQVDLSRRVAWVHADQAKAKKPIGVPLNNDAVVVLRGQLGNHNTRVFSLRGKPIRNANTKGWRRALDRAGIRPYYPPPTDAPRTKYGRIYPTKSPGGYLFDDFRWHDLRHTWASWHVQGGTPLHALQELGGWSDIRMVQRYAHLAPEHLAKYADRLAIPRVVPDEIRTLSGTPQQAKK